MPHSSGFIEKCVEFLLDPEVRKLSLAHRVEFLETKGLSPEEITFCLQKVRSQNGLSQVFPLNRSFNPSVQFSISPVLSGDQKEITSSWVKVLIEQMGALTVLGVILTYGYHRLQEKIIEKCIISGRKIRLERKRQRNFFLETKLKTWEPQMTQQQQLIDLLTMRVDNMLTKKKELAKTWSNIQDIQAKRQQHFKELQSQVNFLRDKVQEKIMSLQVNSKTKESKRITAIEEERIPVDIVKDPRGQLNGQPSSVQVTEPHVNEEMEEQEEEGVFGLEQFEERSLARDYSMLL